MKKQLNESEKIDIPFNWGGQRLVPSYVEFWKGRKDRMHDRVAYTKLKEKSKETYGKANIYGKWWEVQVLQP